MRFVIWPNDHDPHLHIYMADGLVVVKLGRRGRKAEIRKSIHVSDADPAPRLASKYQTHLQKKWEGTDPNHDRRSQ